MDNFSFRQRSQSGFSLIEFMVAGLLGGILIGGAVFVFVSSNRSYLETERSIILSDSGRFALQILNDSLRHAGFFGGVALQDIDQDASLSAVTGDCTGFGAAYDMRRYIFAQAADGSGNAFGCITDAVPGSDVLLVKYLRPDPVDSAVDPNDAEVTTFNDLDGKTTYLIANAERGLLLDGADTPPDVGAGQIYARGTAWPYEFQIFYVREGGVPSLVRKTLAWNGAGMSIQTEDMVQGVQVMRFRFGWDSSGDGDIDQYGYLDGVGDSWDSIGIVEVFLLLRSADEEFSYENKKSYVVGDTIVDGGGDHYWRLLMSSSVTLRNPNLFIRSGV
ncbi:PilW family protein [Mangrovimicrobium sediminis]|nr:PilW family protein [Haliea sp. SAOS-164]